MRETLLPTPVVSGRFVIRATHERGVGVPSSRSLSTASREASASLSETTDDPIPIPSESGGGSKVSRTWPGYRADGCLIRVYFVTRSVASAQSMISSITARIDGNSTPFRSSARPRSCGCLRDDVGQCDLPEHAMVQGRELTSCATRANSVGPCRYPERYDRHCGDSAELEAETLCGATSK